MSTVMRYLVAVVALAGGAYCLFYLKNPGEGTPLIFLAGLLSDWADAQKILDLWRKPPNGA